MTAADISTGTLQPTATYARRRWCFVPSGGGEHLGTLTIVLQRCERRGKRAPAIEVGTYSVQEDFDPAFANHEVRVFLLKKDGSEAGEIYATAIGASHTSCSCKAAKCKVESGCRHVHAMSALLSEGVL